MKTWFAVADGRVARLEGRAGCGAAAATERREQQSKTFLNPETNSKDKRRVQGIVRRTLMTQPKIVIVSAWAFSERHTRKAAAVRSSDMVWCSPMYPSISASPPAALESLRCAGCHGGYTATSEQRNKRSRWYRAKYNICLGFPCVVQSESGKRKRNGWGSEPVRCSCCKTRLLIFKCNGLKREQGTLLVRRARRLGNVCR